MLKKSFSAKPMPSSFRGRSTYGYALLFLCFLIGSLLGTLLGKGTFLEKLSGSCFPFSAESQWNFLLSAIQFLWVHFFVLIMGFTVFGFWLIPIFTIFRAALLSCISSTIIVSFSGREIIMALIIVALPSFFSLPVFFALASDSAAFSRRLFAISRGGFFPQIKNPFSRSLRWLPFLLLGAGLNFVLVPYLISIIG